MEGQSDLPPVDGPVVYEAAQFSHPAYPEMITTAILALNEKDGSSRQAIDKYIQSQYSNLSASHATVLTQQLRAMKAQGLLVLNKHSYMLPGSEFLQSPVQVSVEPKRRPGRPPKIQSNGSESGVGTVDLSATQVFGDESGVAADVTVPQANVVPFDPIGAVPTVVPIGQVDGEAPVKRRPGRPPKIHAMVGEGEGEAIPGVEPVLASKRSGRPPKNNNVMAVVAAVGSVLGKRGRGRPPKKPGMVSALMVNGGVKKGRGRPPKMRSVGLVMGQRGRGRPRKGAITRPRGRPRKNVAFNGGSGGVTFMPVEEMGNTGRPSKMAVRRNPRKLSGKPLGRPKKDASVLQSHPQQPITYQDLKGRVEHFQSRVKQAVGVVKPYLDNEVAPIALGVLQELEVLALTDMSVPITGESPTITGPSAAPSSDHGGPGGEPVAPFPVQGLEPVSQN